MILVIALIGAVTASAGVRNIYSKFYLVMYCLHIKSIALNYVCVIFPSISLTINTVAEYL